MYIQPTSNSLNSFTLAPVENARGGLCDRPLSLLLTISLGRPVA